MVDVGDIDLKVAVYVATDVLSTGKAGYISNPISRKSDSVKFFIIISIR